ncbi:MAG: hypothetical protein ACLRRH_11155 [Clostridium sp.]
MLNAGDISLNLLFNREGFNNQIRNLASSLSSALGIGLSTVALVNFTKSSLELGSDLAEVQNVVDVTFGSMAEDINEFASTAITQLGLSETSAKQYASTMGAMLKSMGLSTKQALEMSKAITSLSADMASFYNLDNDMAFEKIRAGISGETEPLKALGINMSVANMEAYALSQGIDKAYDSMSQSEQAILRYNYLLSVTADAQGDFARTSDGWANQTRILTEQWNAFKATMGQAFINVLSPVVKWLNTIISKLQIAANAFKSFIDQITGNTDSSNATASIADNLVGATDGANSLTDGLDDAVDSAKEVVKEVSRLQGFDEINLLSKSSDSNDDSPIDMDISSIGNSNDGINKTTNEAKEMSTVFDGIIKKVQELTNLFKQGFKIGLGDMSVFDSIRNNIYSVKKSFIDIFTDGEVIKAADNLLNSIALYLGKHYGAITSVGATIADFFTGSIAKYLDKNKNFIKEKIISIFNVKAEILDTIGDLEVAIADIFTVFRGDTAKQIGSDLVEIFANSFLEIVEISEKLGRDIINCIAKPIIDNKDAIKQAMQGTLEAIQEVTGTIANFVSDTWKKIEKLYDEHIKPFFDAIAEGISSIVETLLKNYNQYIVPLLKWIGDKFTELVEKHVSPMVDKILNFVGKIIDALKDIWKNVLVPFINWIINTIVPKIVPIVKTIVEIVSIGIGTICDVIGGIMDALSGIIDFITGVFTGDWKKAWKGVKEIFGGIWDSLGEIVKGALNVVIDIANWAIKKINKALTINIPDWDILPDSMQGKSYSFEIPTIQKLAQGGFVKANTPQLAMIGDNTRYGEIVAPENKLSELLDKAVSKGGADEEVLYKAFLRALKDMPNNDVVLNVDGVRLGNAVAKGVNKITKANGGICPIIT